jgi:hypothetical protein
VEAKIAQLVDKNKGKMSGDTEARQAAKRQKQLEDGKKLWLALHQMA